MAIFTLLRGKINRENRASKKWMNCPATAIQKDGKGEKGYEKNPDLIVP